MPKRTSKSDLRIINPEEEYRDFLGESALDIIIRANNEVRLREHDYLTPEHILKVITELDRPLFDREVKGLKLDPTAVIQALNATLAKPKDTSPKRCRIEARVNGVTVPTYHVPCGDVIHHALIEAHKQGRRLIESKDILAALLQGRSNLVRELLELHGLSKEPDFLGKKILELIMGHPGAKGTAELETLLKETSEEVRMATLQKAAALTLPQSPYLQCSFCGKSQNEIKKLIAGPTVYICNECVDICNEIIADDQRS